MIKIFEEVITKKQKDKLVATSVKALVNLVNLPERRDIINSLVISTKEDQKPDYGTTWGFHRRKLILSNKGLEEVRTCGEHKNIGWPDEVHWEKCEYDGRSEIKEIQYPRMVKEYQITQEPILSAKEKLVRG